MKIWKSFEILFKQIDNSQDGQIMARVNCIIKGQADSTFQMAHLMSLDELNLISHRDNWDIVPKNVFFLPHYLFKQPGINLSYLSAPQTFIRLTTFHMPCFLVTHQYNCGLSKDGQWHEYWRHIRWLLSLCLFVCLLQFRSRRVAACITLLVSIMPLTELPLF